MEDHYSSEEEEVYFGSLAESEVFRRKRFLGSNYNSPVTPRPPRFNQASNGMQGGLPDVLGTSTPVQSQLSAGSRSKVSPLNQSIQHNLPLDDSLDDVIILDASENSNSVITLSDDESFVRNEETCSNKSATAENINGSMEKTSICEISNKSDTGEISKPHHESSSSGSDFDPIFVVAEDKGLQESDVHNSENDSSLNENSAFNSEISIQGETAPVIEPHHGNFTSGKDVSISVNAEDESLHESATNNSDNKNSLNDNSILNNEVSIKSKSPVIEPHHGNCTSGKDIVSTSVIAEDESLHESATNNSDDKNSLNDNSILNNEVSIKSKSPVIEPHHGNCTSGKDIVSTSVIAEDESLHESATNNSDNKNSLNDNSILNNEVSIKSKSPVIEPHHGNCTSGKDIVSTSVIAEDESLHESAINNSENGYSLSDYSSFSHFETNFLHTTADKCELSYNVENISSSLVQDIDEFVGDSNALEKSSATVDQITDGQSLNPSGFNASEVLSKELPELQKSVNIADEKTDTNARKHGKNSLDMSGLSNLEFSLNGVTDSILNISHGSTLPSPPDTHQSPGKNTNFYEDISFDGEQLGNITDISNFNDKTNKEDLHMSVDEVDFQQQRFTNNFVALSSLENSINISQPSGYKSCPSAYSSYTTAYDKTHEDHSKSEQSNSFQNYRDASTDLEICTEMDAVSIKSNEENANEANFEMVLQNRQNSFNGTPASKMSKNKKGENSQVMSKLPVYQSSKGLLRPPTLIVKPDTLKTTSYKFAKQISKTGSENHSSNLPKPEICKIPGLSSVNRHVKSPSTNERKIPLEKEKTKTPSKISAPKPNMQPPKQLSSLTKSKIPSHCYLSVIKTPAQNVNKSPAKGAVNKTPAQKIVNKSPAKGAVNRTPAQNISGIPRVVKSDSKVYRVLTPSRDCNMSGLSAGKSIPSKNRYKNIISPIQSYIRGSPPVSQRKAQVISEEQECPERQQSMPQNVTPTKSAPRAFQKLNYENVQGQENVNPNIIDPSRDTLPCKILEPSLEVFWKEGEQPQSRLPKMGEKLTKILAGPPKIKVTIHEGRVTKSPMSKGILVPNNENTTSTSSDVDSLPSDISEGRISVRIQKTIELP